MLFSVKCDHQIFFFYEIVEKKICHESWPLNPIIPNCCLLLRKTYLSVKLHSVFVVAHKESPPYPTILSFHSSLLSDKQKLMLKLYLYKRLLMSIPHFCNTGCICNLYVFVRVLSHMGRYLNIAVTRKP